MDILSEWIYGQPKWLSRSTTLERSQVRGSPPNQPYRPRLVLGVPMGPIWGLCRSLKIFRLKILFGQKCWDLKFSKCHFLLNRFPTIAYSLDTAPSMGHTPPPVPLHPTPCTYRNPLHKKSGTAKYRYKKFGSQRMFPK